MRIRGPLAQLALDKRALFGDNAQRLAERPFCSARLVIAPPAAAFVAGHGERVSEETAEGHTEACV